MERGNETFVSGFILQRIFNQAGHQGLVFSILLSVYLLSLLGNLLIVLLIRCDARLLHTPMYFFLSYLSLADAGFASSTVPVTLRNLVSQDTTISFSGCLFQMYFFLAFGNSDSFLLAAMAYDRYMAICHPLQYTALMDTKRCIVMIFGCWLLAFLHSLIYPLMLSRLSFCASHEIRHFFCDLSPLVGLSCSDTTPIKMVVVTEGVLDILGPCILIVVSYVRIFLTVMKMPSSSKSKAFSTCGSHLAVVLLFYGSLIWVYLLPPSKNKTLASVMYTVVTPMLNPFIYSLRNDEMKGALRRLAGRMRVSQNNWK